MSKKKEKKVQKKSEVKKKVDKGSERKSERLVESFISSSTTSLLSLFGAKLWLDLIATLASQSYSLFASILKFLCVCDLFIHFESFDQH